MAVNYTAQFAPKVLETMALESLTDSASSQDFNFDGTKSIRVMTVDTVPLNDYKREGTNRYGEPVELGDMTQLLTMKEDKSFAITIDKGNSMDQMNLKGAAEALKRQTAQVVVPYIDKYRLATWAHCPGTQKTYAADVLKTQLVQLAFEAAAAMDEKGVPQSNRTLFISNKYYRYLALQDRLCDVDSLGEKALRKGIVGELAGMTVKRVPESYLPTGVVFLAKWKGASVDPVKLQESKIHKDPPGLSGNLLEGRIYQDSFVLEKRVDGIFLALESNAMPTMPVVNYNGNQITLGGGITGVNNEVWYTVDGSDPRLSDTAIRYQSTVTLETGTLFRAVNKNTKTGLCSNVNSYVVKG